jgi:hypothetical protein
LGYIDEFTPPDNMIQPYVHLALADTNSVFIIAADQCGSDREYRFPGRSCIVGPTGILAGPAAVDHPEIVQTEIDVTRARQLNWMSYASFHGDRRTDLIDSFLGYREPSTASAAFHPEPIARPRISTADGTALEDAGNTLAEGETIRHSTSADS